MPVTTARGLGLAVIVCLGLSARLPATSTEGAADRFAFSTKVLDHDFGHARRISRDVHRSLHHIQPWIASVGAAAAIGDIDGNLKADDSCYVDTRTNRVVVAPLLSGERGQSSYKPFELPLPPGDWDPATVAPMGCLIGDVNEDGVSDLIAYFWGRPPALYLGNSDRWPAKDSLSAVSFRPDETFSMVDKERWFTNAALLADVDGDGHLDLVVGNYFCDGGRIIDSTTSGPACDSPAMQDSMSRAFNGGVNRILLLKPNEAVRQGRPQVAVITPFSREVGQGWTLAIGAQNLLADGIAPDFYYANDFGPDRLLANCSRAIERFGTQAERTELRTVGLSDEKRRLALEVPVRARLGCLPLAGPLSFKVLEGSRTLNKPRSNVLGQDSFKGMGVEFGDIDGDGIPDIYVSNITEKWALQESQNLYLSQGRTFGLDALRQGTAPYTDQAENLGLSRSGWAWDAKLADFDNDGRMEALQAVGFVRGTSAGPDITVRKSCWALLQELATGNDTLLKHQSRWFDMEHDEAGVGCDLSGDSRRNPFFVLPRQKDVFARFDVQPDAAGALTPARVGRYADAAESLAHLSRRVAPTRGLAIGDANQDGRLDYIEAKQFASPEFHLNRSANAGAKFIAFTPRFLVEPGAGSPLGFVPVEQAAAVRTRPAIGAEVSVELTDLKTSKKINLRAQVDGGNGHSGKRSPEIHFGLGDLPQETPVTIKVAWRSTQGTTTREFKATLRDFTTHKALLL